MILYTQINNRCLLATEINSLTFEIRLLTMHILNAISRGPYPIWIIRFFICNTNQFPMSNFDIELIKFAQYQNNDKYW